MAVLDLPWCVSHAASGVLEEQFLLLGADQTEQKAGLGVVIVVILTEIPVVGGSLQGQRRLGEVRLLLPLSIAVGLIAKGAAIVTVHPHGTVTVKTVERAAWGVDRDLVMVDPKAVALGVDFMFQVLSTGQN